MRLLQLQKDLYVVNRDEVAQARHRCDVEALLSDFDLDEEERGAVRDGDTGLLYVLGVNGQIPMHFAAFLAIDWFDYLDLMRKGVAKHGPVPAGVYALPWGG